MRAILLLSSAPSVIGCCVAAPFPISRLPELFDSKPEFMDKMDVQFDGGAIK